MVNDHKVNHALYSANQHLDHELNNFEFHNNNIFNFHDGKTKHNNSNILPIQQQSSEDQLAAISASRVEK
jgi:hypothetical protein